VLLMMAILTGVRWNLSVVLICISFKQKSFDIIFNVYIKKKQTLIYFFDYIAFEHKLLEGRELTWLLS
jgi:hypothetical protein